MASARPISEITAAVAYEITEAREEVFAAFAAEVLRIEPILRSHSRFNCCINCRAQGGRVESGRRNGLFVDKNGRGSSNTKSSGTLLIAGNPFFDLVAIPIFFEAGQIQPERSGIGAEQCPRIRGSAPG